jgi:hypothetical protein
MHAPRSDLSSIHNRNRGLALAAKTAVPWRGKCMAGWQVRGGRHRKAPKRFAASRHALPKGAYVATSWIRWTGDTVASLSYHISSSGAGSRRLAPCNPALFSYGTSHVCSPSIAAAAYDDVPCSYGCVMVGGIRPSSVHGSSTCSSASPKKNVARTAGGSSGSPLVLATDVVRPSAHGID